jgi:histidinol-phosphate aminotransferase
LHTLSKAWGLAALRLGMAFASTEIVNIMNKVKPPYNIGQSSQDLALKALDEVGMVNDMIQRIVNERQSLAEKLSQLAIVEKVYDSDANFLLVKTSDAKGIYNYLLGKGIVVRDRSKVELCAGCLRITVGTEKENRELTDALSQFA